MNKDYFCKSGICDKKVNEIIEKSQLADGRDAFRIIKHKDSIPLSETDFYPSIMEYSGNVMPIKEKQENKDIRKFGMSVLDSYEHAIQFKISVPSMREHYCLAKGFVDKNKGSIGLFDGNGHYQYFLFNPINNNPVCDFIYCKEGAEKHERN